MTKQPIPCAMGKGVLASCHSVCLIRVESRLDKLPASPAIGPIG